MLLLLWYIGRSHWCLKDQLICTEMCWSKQVVALSVPYSQLCVLRGLGGKNDLCPSAVKAGPNPETHFLSAQASNLLPLTTYSSYYERKTKHGPENLAESFLFAYIRSFKIWTFGGEEITALPLYNVCFTICTLLMCVIYSLSSATPSPNPKS